ncbi:MAG: NO-inducible flavohemoprotein [Gammaproteobacteria bacterium]|nr:NO-inducible flavohemoprotein [Gammaproteobacteria bacterium]
MVSQQSKDIIAATLPAVRENAMKITSTFYPLMFERYPQVKAYFNENHQREGTQRQALANAVVAYAANLDRLEVLGDAVSLIVHKHASLSVLPKHYPIVGECLLEAIAIVFGDAATDEVLGAWGEAYQQLADILISAEEAVYQANEQKTGGWRGEREFVLARREKESEVITSFYFEPADGGPVADFKPGQYIGITLNIDGQEVRRNYSLSNSPGESYYRLSIKRENDGQVSAFLHDTLNLGDKIKLTAPAGDFVLEQSARPLMLLTGGVGITPAISMLKPALQSGRPVQFFHCATNGGHHAFKQQVDDLASEYDNLSVTYCYSAPSASDNSHLTGFIDQAMIEPLVQDPADLEFYFLGPKPFMESCHRIAKGLGIPEERVRFEFFGPLQSLEASGSVGEEVRA